MLVPLMIVMYAPDALLYILDGGLITRFQTIIEIQIEMLKLLPGVTHPEDQICLGFVGNRS